ncbi:MAG: hypothetical protein AAGA68_12640 [Pseudomonadota bacterium]
MLIALVGVLAGVPTHAQTADRPARPSLRDNVAERNAAIDRQLAQRGVADAGASDAVGAPAATSVEEPGRDPFTPLPAFNQRQPGGAPAFIANPTPGRAPELELKGIVDLEDEVTALLRIGPSRVFMVRQGDQITFDPTRPGQAIKIREISRLSVVVEIGSIGNVVVVR